MREPCGGKREIMRREKKSQRVRARGERGSGEGWRRERETGRANGRKEKGGWGRIFS